MCRQIIVLVERGYNIQVVCALHPQADLGRLTNIGFLFIGGDTLDAMAKAVENSVAVIICITEEYQRSPNCRLGKY